MNGLRVRGTRMARIAALSLVAACGPGKDDPSSTEATSGTSATSTSGGPDSLSHSATSSPPTTSGVPTGTSEAPTSSGPVTTEALTTGGPTTSTSGFTVTGGPGPGTTGGPAPGEAYGPCLDEEPQCPEGHVCALLAEIPGNFCASPCSTDADCPVVESGAKALCALLPGPDVLEPTHCALVCDLTAPDPGCPGGTSCKPVPDNGTAGVCTAP